MDIAALRTLAAGQDGQFATRQATSLGHSRRAVQWLATTGDVVAVRRGVFRFASTPGQADPAVSAFLSRWPMA